VTELIRSWPDSLFYYSAASTANVREQLTKVQQASKLLRALSDASTVNTNGDKLQDILTGLSLGNSTQRHKYRALYDTTNDRYLVQRNSGTDASKTWVELFRIDSSGNVIVTGTLSNTGLITASAGIRMGGNLDMNQFYIRNLEKINGRTRTDTLTVHGVSALTSVTVSGTASLTTLSVSGTSTLTGATSVRGANVFDYTYAETATTQSISASTETNVTSLTGLTLPNTAATLTSRKFMLSGSLSVTENAGSNNLAIVRVYNGPNGNKSDTEIYRSAATLVANSLGDTIPIGPCVFTPGAVNRTKIGVSIQTVGASTVQGVSPLVSTFMVREVTT
jgi:hypothetical protein